MSKKDQGLKGETFFPSEIDRKDKRIGAGPTQPRSPEARNELAQGGSPG